MSKSTNAFPRLDNHSVPLILLGGTLCNHRLWQPVINEMNVSSVSSLIISGAGSAPALAKQLLSALPPRFCLAGFSLGAIVALQMLANAPHRIAGLALLSVNPLSDAPANAAGRRAAVQDAARQGMGNWLSATMWPRYVAPVNLADPALHATITQMADESGNETFALQTEIAITRADNRAALKTFTAPTLILNGGCDDICTPQHHLAAAEAAPHARWITLPDSGHFLPLEAPNKVADALRNWIKEILL
ncbi:alpha/beta hydrolase [Enterobacteriaceae bacterium H18W14]|uniref:alpha/beta fold hydrolase n=1 Tax=Dryocola boscaweniae TaxID=2925397 RepID=UPI0022F0CDE3|nr:alpha/beta hydrolase [Dryocola boscaweniae]MCT4717188.1 alpha/beta hydrolase [Dryocola boscaweniae]